MIAFVGIFFMFGCNKTSQTNEVSINSNDTSQLLTTQQINNIIRHQLAQNKSFDWKDVSDKVIWSALQQSDHILSIGYKPANEINVDDELTKINIKESKWQTAKQQVLDLIYNSEKNSQPSLKPTQLEVWKENVLPVIDVYVKDIKTITLLRASNLVRYAEPMGYDPGTYEKNLANKKLKQASSAAVVAEAMMAIQV